jgi:hypothetical protein
MPEKVSSPPAPTSASALVVIAELTAVAVVVVVVVSVVDVSVVVVVVLSDPQAANDRAIRDTPPARAAFAFFYSQTAVNFSVKVGCLLEASISV